MDTDTEFMAIMISMDWLMEEYFLLEVTDIRRVKDTFKPTLTGLVGPERVSVNFYDYEVRLIPRITS